MASVGRSARKPIKHTGVGPSGNNFVGLELWVKELRDVGLGLGSGVLPALSIARGVIVDGC